MWYKAALSEISRWSQTIHACLHGIATRDVTILTAIHQVAQMLAKAAFIHIRGLEETLSNLSPFGPASYDRILDLVLDSFEERLLIHGGFS